jgi:exodeoxyribonuclease V beta subunit
MNLDLVNDAIVHGLVIEASAGTGKTYSVAAIVTRELALRDDLRIGQILITTYTRNAAAELRDRIRRRLVETAGALRSDAAVGGDAIAVMLRTGTVAEVAERARRLERALVEFDSATISTIHGVCSRILRVAGAEAVGVTDTADTDRIVAEVVNDLVVAHASDHFRPDEGKLIPLIKAMLADPFVEPWYDETGEPAETRRLEALKTLLRECVTRINAALTTSPSYNDLLRLAREVVCDTSRPELLAALRQRFTLALVDEAQDTDKQQWMLFERLFEGGDGRALVSVGDPKQAIYGFRGADVRAYVAHAANSRTHRTLTTNRRSDQPMLDALNAAFADTSFGEGIDYIDVSAPADRTQALIRGIHQPVTFVDLGVMTSQPGLVAPVLGAVIDLLDDARLGDKDDPTAPGRLLEPRDICVLVRSGSVGRHIERALVRAGIPAVTGGTSSVMTSEMALDVRSLLEAIEEPSNLGRVRRAAATVFFGETLANVGVLDDDVILGVQDGVMRFSGILARKGVAALGAAIEADATIMTRVAAGRHGERNITDFLHVIEVMDASGPRGGCTAEKALTIFTRLATMEDTHDLVSRRVESDADAVKILTIHKAKGLQFPCVIVADLWKDARARPPAVFYDTDKKRKLDIGFALDSASPRAKQLQQAAENEETRRLLYVAATRAEHSLTILVARQKPSKNGPAPESILEQTMALPAVMASPSGRTHLVRKLVDASAPAQPLALAPAPKVNRTYRRMSFTGISAVRGPGRVDGAFEPEGGGYDEPRSPGASDLVDLPTPKVAGARRDVIDLPAGVAVGRVVHEIFEQVDTTVRPLADEVRRVVEERATSGKLRRFHENLTTIVTESLETPLGGPFDDVTLAEIPPGDRIPEMDFEMGLAPLLAGVQASSIGRVLQEVLSGVDPLRAYADTLASSAFDVPVGGLLNGSIDAVLRLPGSTPVRPRLVLADYKSNKLHKTGMEAPLRAYHPDRLVAAMAEHHYPLQAVLYGTAVYRMLRWRLPEADPDDCIAGVVYGFIRGMKGPDTPTDERGHRYGVFSWQPPRGLWARLSDLLVAADVGGGAS